MPTSHDLISKLWRLLSRSCTHAFSIFLCLPWTPHRCDATPSTPRHATPRLAIHHHTASLHHVAQCAHDVVMPRCLPHVPRRPMCLLAQARALQSPPCSASYMTHTPGDGAGSSPPAQQHIKARQSSTLLFFSSIIAAGLLLVMKFGEKNEKSRKKNPNSTGAAIDDCRPAISDRPDPCRLLGEHPCNS